MSIQHSITKVLSKRAVAVDIAQSVPLSVSVTSMPGAGAEDAYVVHDSATVLSTATDDLVVIASAPADFRLSGWSATGNGDGLFVVSIGGSAVDAGRIKFHQPSVMVAFPTAMEVTAGVEVKIAVTNEAEATAAYEGSLFGEVDA